MATYDVRETTTDNSVSTKLDDEGYAIRTAQRKFTIVATPVGQDSLTVEDAATDSGTPTKLPALNEQHPWSTFLFVIDRNTSRISGTLFESVITYESDEFTPDEDDPLELPAKISWTSVQSDEGIDMDWFGNPLENIGTHEPIMGITRRISDLELTVQKNLLLFNPIVIMAYEGTVNSDTFLGAPPGVAFLSKIAATNAIKNDVPYWEVTVNVIFRQAFGDTPIPKTWHKRIKHEGFWEVRGTGFDKKTVRAKDDEKQYVTTPVLLDNQGRRLEEGAETFWQYFQVYDQRQFGPLGILP